MCLIPSVSVHHLKCYMLICKWWRLHLIFCMRGLVRSNTDVGRQSSLVSQFIPKDLDGVEIRTLCRSVMSYHTKLKTITYWAGFVYKVIVMLRQERDQHKMVTKLSAQYWLGPERERVPEVSALYKCVFGRIISWSRAGWVGVEE